MDLFNKKKLQKMEKEKNYYERICEAKNITINNLNKEKSELNKIIDNLLKDNSKLIDWVEKIIDEVGVKTNCKDNSINIPYYEDIHYEETRIAGNYERDYFPKQQRKEIIVPAIRFIKYEFKE